MIQTATINPNNGHTLMMPSILGGIHPNNMANVHGKIVSRSPSNYSPLPHSQDNRNLSPNKLNATKKPMINANNNNVNHNNFVNRNKGIGSPTAQFNNTNKFVNNYHSNPSNLNNNYSNNSNNAINYQNFNPMQNMKNPPLINSGGYENKGMPLISANMQERSKYCQNHTNKPSEYTVQTQQGQDGYCQKCAINLASKGIEVVKRDGKLQAKNARQQYEKFNIFDQHKLQPFYGNKYNGILGFSQINKFITQVDSIHGSFLSQIHKYQTIEEHYEHQYRITQEFYENLMAIVDQMREDHLADLQAEAKKHTQIAYIKQDHLKSDLSEVEIIRNDLVMQIQSILQRFNDNQIQSALNQYKQQTLIFKSKIQQENAQFQEAIIDEKEGQLKKRLKLIQQYLLNVWNTKNNDNAQMKKKQINRNFENRTTNNFNRTNQADLPFKDKSPKNIKNILQIGDKGYNQNKNQNIGTACRKLFDDENQNPLFQSNQIGQDRRQYEPIEQPNKEIASPQFKNI